MVSDRFWKRVKKTDGCWWWTGGKNNRGYGQFSANQSAHRKSWEIANKRKVPKGLFVLHSCDRPKCVRPSHLFLGTQADNVADMIAKGRDFRGVGKSKISRADAAKIRAEKRYAGVIPYLAKLYGLTEGHISNLRIKDSQIWRDKVA